MKARLRIPAASGSHAPLYRQSRDALLIYFFGWGTEPYIRASIALDVAEHNWKPEMRHPVEVWREIQHQRREAEQHRCRWWEPATAHLTQVLEANAPTLVDTNRTIKLELVEV